MDNYSKEVRLNIRIQEDLKNAFFECCKDEFKKPSEKLRELVYDYVIKSRKQNHKI